MISVCELVISRLEESVALPVEDGDANQAIVSSVIMESDFAHVVRVGNLKGGGGLGFEIKLVTGAICSAEGVAVVVGVDCFDVVVVAECRVKGEHEVVGLVLGRVADQL